jgi:hypothetical protein
MVAEAAAYRRPARPVDPEVLADGLYTTVQGIRSGAGRLDPSMVTAQPRV